MDLFACNAIVIGVEMCCVVTVTREDYAIAPPVCPSSSAINKRAWRWWDHRTFQSDIAKVI
jgi:hypothetical protein